MAGRGAGRMVVAGGQTSAENANTALKLCQPPHGSFVLWGEQFDEIAAVLFVGALRQVGLKVKIIGLAGHTSAGLHQMTLGVDLTLGDALAPATPATCLIIPCDGGILRRFDNDPRLFHFLTQICLPQTQIIVKERYTLAPTTLEQLAIPPEQLAIYSASTNLWGFAHDIAHTLASTTWAN